VVVYLNTPEAGAVIAAERLRSGVEELMVNDDQGSRIPITVSLGASELRAEDTLESFVDRADRAMYASKESGRNRLTVAQADERDAPRLSVDVVREEQRIVQ
jgi:diguanylate cyclase (GGDEF)-like protein